MDMATWVPRCQRSWKVRSWSRRTACSKVHQIAGNHRVHPGMRELTFATALETALEMASLSVENA